MIFNGKETECVSVLGARVHNLKNIDVDIPHYKLTVITGLSGSGKSSLAFDTIFAEGQRRYLETFSAYARNMLGVLERPDVDKITGLSPVISIGQKTTNKNPRSTVGTSTEVYDYLRLLFARAAIAERKATSALMRVSISEANIPPTIASVSHDCQVKESIPIEYNTAAKLPLFLRKTHHLQLKINRPNQQNN